MMWRIGNLLDLHEQIRWLHEHRFEAVAFWTSAGEPGVWQGFEFASAAPADVRALRAALADFEAVDLHADAPLTGVSALPRLRRTLAFAAELGASTVTVHVESRSPRRQDELASLDAAAQRANVRVGLELTADYGLALSPATPHLGLTLDVGHVSFEGGAGYREFGSLAGLIDHVSSRLFHVHAHDYDGLLDHLPIGAGRLNWNEIAAALKRVRYAGVVCLELNPDRASPGQLLASRDRLTELLASPSAVALAVPPRPPPLPYQPFTHRSLLP